MQLDPICITYQVYMNSTTNFLHRMRALYNFTKRTTDVIMGFWAVFLASIAFSHFVQSHRIVEKLIIDYFHAVNIHHINVFGCLDDTNALEFSRNVMNLDNAVTYNSISSDVHLRGILKVDYYHVGVVLDHDCPMSDFILDKFSNDLVFNQSYFWLILTNSSSPLDDVLRNLPLTVESELTVATGDDNTFKLWDVYNPSYSHGGVVNVTYKGHWNRENGLKNQLNQYKYHRRSNFNLLPLNWSIVLRNPPLPDLDTYLTTPVNRHLDTMSRYHYALVLHLKDFFNFSINLQNYESWGYLVNGTFGGLLGALIKGQTDASVAAYQYKTERMDIVDYLAETLNVQLRFFFRHPRSNDLQNNFLKPFAMHLWWMIIAVGLLYWIFMAILRTVEIYYERVEVDEDTISTTALTTIAAITQQGLSTAPIIASGRMVFLSLFVWTLLLFQFYSASIVGSLLAPPQRWITTMENLSNSNLECAIEDMPYMVDYFATTANPRSKEMFQQKIKPTKKKPKGSYMPAAEGLQRVRKGGFAFHINLEAGYKMIEDTFKENEICELQQIDMVGQCLTSMVTRKHSPFNEMFTWRIRKAVESGLTQRIQKIWHHQCPQCPESYSSNPTPVSMQQFSPAIFLLLMGFSLSIFILIIEYLYYCKCSDHSSNVEDTNSTANTDDIEKAQPRAIEDLYITNDG